MPEEMHNLSLSQEFIKEQGALSARVHNIEKDLQEMNIKLNKVVSFVDETKGGKKYLWWLLTLSTALGGLMGSAATYLNWGIK